MVLTEGWDCPPVSCCILARPTKKMGLFRQMIGRALRSHAGKPDTIILDHSGAVHAHGLPEDDVAWTLDPDTLAMAPEHEKRQSSRELKLVECSQCGALRKGGLPCPACGFLPRRPPECIHFADEDLVQVGTTKREYKAEEKDRWLAQLAHIQQQREYKPGWVFFKFKEKFGHSPPLINREPESP